MKVIKNKKMLLVTGCVTICTAAVLVGLNPLQSKADSTWSQIGNGNLSVMDEQGDYLFYPTPIDYIQPLQGVKGKEFKLGNSDEGYKLDAKTFTVAKMASIKTNITLKSEQIESFKVGSKLFLGTNEISKRTASNKIITEDGTQSNLFTVDDNGNSKSLLSEVGKSTLQQKISKLNETRGEDKLALNWASNPYAVSNGSKVAFLSNKKAINNNTGENSLYVVNEDGTNETLVVDSAIYGDLRLVGTANDLVLVDTENDSIVVTNAKTNDTKELPIKGRTYSFSPDGKSVLYRKLINGDALSKDFYIYNLETNGECMVTGMPDRYVYNTGGSWSPDGKRFVFIANGLDQIDATKLYRDNNLLVAINTETMQYENFGKPAVTASIYPLGTVQWVGNDKVTTYLDNNTTWMVNAPQGGLIK